jgi:hypothetical protein
LRVQCVGHGLGQTGGHDVLQALCNWQAGIGFGHDPREVGRGQGHTRAGVGDVVAKLVGPVHGVDGHHHRVGALHGIKGHHELRAVLHEQQHAVTTLHALRLQPAGQRRRPAGAVRHN